MAYRAWTLRHSFEVWQIAVSGLIAAAVAVGLMLHLFRLRGALGAGRGGC
jgi:hypothetical protein